MKSDLITYETGKYDRISYKTTKEDDCISYESDHDNLTVYHL